MTNQHLIRVLVRGFKEAQSRGDTTTAKEIESEFDFMTGKIIKEVSYTSLTPEVIQELTNFIGVFLLGNHPSQVSLLNKITLDKAWGNFPNIRSMNKHINVSGYKHGIKDWAYAIVCKVLMIHARSDNYLTDSKPY